MSSKEATPQNVEPAKKAESKNEATKVSATWLSEKVDRWLGHGARTLGGEYVIANGASLASKGALNAMGYATIPPIAPHSLALAATGLGGALAAVGAWAEWKMGMQHAKSKVEKGLFWASKAGQVAAPLIDFYLPAYRPVAMGLYAVGIAMGFAGMRHRPEAGKGKGDH